MLASQVLPSCTESNVEKENDTGFLFEEKLAAARDLIYNADLTSTLNRLVYIEGWTVKAAKTAIALYRNFLYLLLKYPDKLILPSQEIDEVWHAHILHTREYREFCDLVFGRYIDHSPSEHKLNAQFEVMQDLYNTEFGNYIFHIRRFGLGYIRIMLKKLWMTI